MKSLSTYNISSLILSLLLTSAANSAQAQAGRQNIKSPDDDAQVEYLCKSKKSGKQFLILPQFGEIHEFSNKNKLINQQDSLSVERTLEGGTPNNPEKQVQSFRHEEGDVVAVISEKAFTAQGPISMKYKNETLDCKKALVLEKGCFTQSSDSEILTLRLNLGNKPSKFFVGEFLNGFAGELNLPLGNGGILALKKTQKPDEVPLADFVFLEQDDAAPITEEITFNADHGMNAVAINKKCNSMEFARNSQFAKFMKNVTDELGVETNKRTKFLDLSLR